MKSRGVVSAVAAGCVVLACGGGAEGRTIEEIHGFEPHFVCPPEAGMVSIKEFGAVGDGKTDDTQAFLKAFGKNEPRAIYVPAGTYLVGDQIRYGVNDSKKKKVCIMGECRSRSIIKLADGSPGFGDSSRPKAFLYTRHPRQQGEQNMQNFLYHLTIEVGRNNPGAVALNYHSNNTGAVKDVTIRAADPVNHPGHTGLACWDWNVGPANARYVTVEGFRTGISLTKAGNYFTMEHITVRRCATGVVCGTCSIRDLRAADCDLPLRSEGLTVLLDAVLKGRGAAAVQNAKGGLLARNVRTAGFARAIASPARGGDAAGPDVALYASDAPVFSWKPPAGMEGPIALPVAESPEVQYPQSAEDWAVMPRKGDISGALQEAIDAGKKTVYIPGGYGNEITRTVHIRGGVERIMGVGNAYVRLRTGEQPVFRLADGSAKVVILELLYGNYGSDSRLGVEQASPRTLVVRHGSLSYRTADAGAGGKVFMESLVNFPVVFRRVRAWVRDIDTEKGGPDHANLVNDGGMLWVLGQKTEDFATKLKTVNGGFTELLGGIYRQNWDQSDFNRSGIRDDGRPPLFRLVDSHASLTYASWGPAKPYVHLVRETRRGETRNLQRSAHGGEAVLFVGYTKRPPADAAPGAASAQR